MYQLRPPHVLVLDEVMADPLMRARAERVLAALPSDTPVHTCSDKELPQAAMDLGWKGFGGRMGMPPPDDDPVFFFGKMRWDGKWPEHSAHFRDVYGSLPYYVHSVYGYDAFRWFTSGQSEIAPCADHVCRPAWRIHLVRGCPHKCFYCGLHNPWTLMMNVEEYITKLDELARKNPFQTTWLYEDDSEALAQEPEYGGLPAIMEWCAQSENSHVIVHTKSANVDWMKDLDHNGRTILVWSLTGNTQSNLMEPATATMAERIEAAAKCQSWGYTIRYKYKPIVPVKGWQDEISEMTKMVFDQTRPDVISVFTLAWMDYAELLKLADTSLIDPRFLDGARDAAEEFGKVKVRPFPHELRKEVYEHCYREIRRYDQQVPVSLCTESVQMWQELGPMLNLGPANYPCGCGPQANPNLAQLAASPWKIARPVAVDGDPPIAVGVVE